MRLRCPCCGASNSLDALIAHDEARAAVKAALELDAAMGNLVYQYLGLFRPAKNALGWDRVATLLGTLNTMIASAQITHNGAAYAAPRAVWQDAIRQTLANRPGLSLPLDNHRYLMTVVAGMASQQARQAEKDRDSQRSGNTTVAVAAVPRPEMTVMPVMPARTEKPKAFTDMVNQLKRQKGITDVQTTAGTTTNGTDKPDTDRSQ